ncbi:outer dense fiber protein 2 [Anabrus simplex]|uniref:outer dense fiber protein 2 n=1 Tax=Anabrus simplex TaxID=316456 RepID=UPI0035A370C5
MWFQHDGAPPHFSLSVRDLLHQRFEQWWIGRGGPIAWPVHSPKNMKTLIYETPVESNEDLLARVMAAADVGGPGIDDRVYENMRELSEEDTLVLKLKKLELVKKLGEFEEITQKVQQLIGLPNMKNVPLSKSLEDQLKCLPSSPSSMMLFDGRSDASSASSALEVIPEEDEECRCKEEDIARFKKMEDTIPKVIVCGAESRVPRIIVCETPKTSPPQPNVCRCPSPPEDVCGCPPPPEDVCGCPPPPEDVCRCPPPPEDVCRCPPPPEDDCRCPLPPGDDSQDYLLQSLTCRLSESYTMQEKLASDNAQLEKGRYYLQEELLQKDTAVEVLQRRVGSLQREMRIISKENTVLSEKLSEINQMDCWCGKKPSRVNNKPQTAPCGCGNPKLQQYSNTTSHLERQLRQIEGEVKSMQCELVQVQRERQQLEQQRKLLKCSQPPAAAPAGPPCPPCCPRNQSRDGGPEQALRELKEQYSRLQDDYKCKVAEVAALKRENDELKCANDRCNEVTDEYENQIRNLQTQLRAVEQELKKFKGSKDQVSSHEQQLQIAKQRLRDAQDELEELRGLVTEQSSQLEEYRNKYLQAQQMVEEQRRQIDKMEVDNNRITDQVNLEIQRVKSQFQEKLQELTPLPDILKATQMKLQEAQQMRLLAERNCEDMAQEAKLLKEKVAQLLKELENNQNSHQLGSDEREAMLAKLEMWEKKYSEAHEDLCRARAELARVEEMACQAQRRLDEKIHEVAQLSTQLETVREESARQVARIKDRMETVRRSLQCQISELERQLAQSRAAAKSAQKDRDEIRQRMQCQINNLNENFDQAQMRIRSLQSHVNFLKTSYTNIFEGGNMMIQDGPAYGLDSRCDCNF